MKPKGKIRRTKAGRWSYTRPAFGFGKPEKRVFARWQDAISYATDRISGGSCQVEQAFEGSDGIAARPRWSALEETG